MYVNQQPYKCVRCSFEFAYSPDVKHPAPVFYEEEETKRGTVVHSKPLCPRCYEEFMLKNIGFGLCTVDWGLGADYDRFMEKSHGTTIQKN